LSHIFLSIVSIQLVVVKWCDFLDFSGIMQHIQWRFIAIPFPMHLSSESFMQ